MIDKRNCALASYPHSHLVVDVLAQAAARGRRLAQRDLQEGRVKAVVVVVVQWLHVDRKEWSKSAYPGAHPYLVFDSTVVSITACHAVDPGSIPGRRAFSFVLLSFFFFASCSRNCEPMHVHLHPSFHPSPMNRLRNIFIFYLCLRDIAHLRRDGEHDRPLRPATSK